MIRNNQKVLNKVISLMNSFGYEGKAKFTVKVVNSTYHVEIVEDLEVRCDTIAYYIRIYSKGGKYLTTFWISERSENVSFLEWIDTYYHYHRQYKYIPIIFELFRTF